MYGNICPKPNYLKLPNGTKQLISESNKFEGKAERCKLRELFQILPFSPAFSFTLFGI
jgi:hypothetical protein